MKKQKFTITRHNRANGTSYYTCTVEIDDIRGAKNIIEFLRYGLRSVPFTYNKQLSKPILLDNSYMYDSLLFDTRLDVLNAIENYIETREKIAGEKVVSTKIEVIYK